MRVYALSMSKYANTNHYLPITMNKLFFKNLNFSKKSKLFIDRSHTEYYSCTVKFNRIFNCHFIPVVKVACWLSLQNLLLCPLDVWDNSQMSLQVGRVQVH